ncbi:hypothetical protein ACFQZW_09505 [Lutibacter aestuarii]|uniref:Uncharacterized protein n=1 Tax=Lutibacter aestuarii TaxID=861111 RepID=A0ABW2Z682_9FLAO|nr:hypothetical protein [uncultured Lutibacter sp.]
MNKIAAVILSLTILFQSFSFDLDDLSKVSTLINHIYCHIDNGDSFTDFIEMHYGSKLTQHENEHRGHQELPFKHQHVDTHFNIVYIICNNNLSIQNKEFIFSSKNFAYKEPITNLIATSIFQPPKVA